MASGASELASFDALTPEGLPAYIAAWPAIRDRVDVSTLAAREVGDGNLNLVFICQDATGRSMCLKQALPYVRMIGPSWQLPARRAAAEAHDYVVASRIARELIPEYYGFDSDRNVLAMEDLSDWVVWRSALREGTVSDGAGAALGRYVALMTLGTSAFGLPLADVRREAQAASNPDMCHITEDLVLTEPFMDHHHNSYPGPLAPDVTRFWVDADLHDSVGELKHRFLTVAEALIHGDLHTGSVMVRPGGGQDGVGPVRVIDGEFCFYGPVGFDLGLLFGNYLLASARARVLSAPKHFMASVTGLIADTWSAFVSELNARWATRADTSLSHGFLDRWLRGVWQDAVGFAGCEAIRRIVNLAKVDEITTLGEREQIAAARLVLRTAREWIVKRDVLADPSALLVVEEGVAQGVLQ